MVSANRDEVLYKYRGRGVFEPVITLKDYVLKMIVEKGPITRSGLVDLTGIPRTTIYDAVVKLITERQVRAYSVLVKERGRPRVFYEAVPSKDTLNIDGNDGDSSEGDEIYRPDLFNY